LFSDPHKTQIHCVGRTWNCWMLNWHYIQWSLVFKGLTALIACFKAIHDPKAEETCKAFKRQANLKYQWLFVCISTAKCTTYYPRIDGKSRWLPHHKIRIHWGRNVNNENRKMIPFFSDWYRWVGPWWHTSICCVRYYYLSCLTEGRATAAVTNVHTHHGSLDPHVLSDISLTSRCFSEYVVLQNVTLDAGDAYLCQLHMQVC
jgi:hypothetical protein